MEEKQAAVATHKYEVKQSVRFTRHGGYIDGEYLDGVILAAEWLTTYVTLEAATKRNPAGDSYILPAGFGRSECTKVYLPPGPSEYRIENFACDVGRELSDEINGLKWEWDTPVMPAMITKSVPVYSILAQGELYGCVSENDIA